METFLTFLKILILCFVALALFEAKDIRDEKRHRELMEYLENEIDININNRLNEYY